MSKNNKNSLDNIKNLNPFDVPKDYFKNFEDNIESKLDKNDNEEFSVPSSYFDDLDLKILMNNSENEEMKLPQNYFENIEGEIFSKTVKETKVIKLSDRRIKSISTYIASIAALALLFLSVLNNYKSSQTLDIDSLLEENTLAFSSQEIYSILNDDDFSLESLSINYEFNDEEAYEYLSESDILDDDLFNE